jgi:hypothetical protein
MNFPNLLFTLLVLALTGGGLGLLFCVGLSWASYMARAFLGIISVTVEVTFASSMAE